jgi:hypothetical protein
MLAIVLALTFQAIPPSLAAPVANDSVRVSGRPSFRARDGSRSVLGPRHDAVDSVGTIRITVQSPYVTIAEIRDDATGCAGPHSVQHWLFRDTLTVVTFSNAPQLCPAAFTPARYEIRVGPLPAARYLVRYYAEGRGGRRGPGSGAAPAAARQVAVP